MQGQVNFEKYFFLVGLSGPRQACLSASAVAHIRGLWQSTQFQQKFSQSRPLIEIHINKFKRHRLRTRSPHDRLRAYTAYP